MGKHHQIMVHVGVDAVKVMLQVRTAQVEAAKWHYE